MQSLLDFSSHYALISEMLETPQVISQFDENLVINLHSKIKEHRMLMLTGEGSSRIFPARNAIFHRMHLNSGPMLLSESSNDLSGKRLDGFAVLGASNSGRTKELVNLFKQLDAQGHESFYAVTCSHQSAIAHVALETLVLPGGGEMAVAATKSVVAQALCYDILLGCWTKVNPQRDAIAKDFKATLEMPFAPQVAALLCEADHIYFAGVNNGVAEELTLKTNEIVRKKSGFFPGSYLLHGVEEVVSANDVIVLVDYMPEHAQKIKEVFVENIGAKVIAFSTEETMFPTVKLSYSSPLFTSYTKLAAGWKLLAEAGIAMNINLDKPARARKVGNEV